MIKVKLTNEIVNRILTIEKARFSVNTIELPLLETNRLRKNSKKKSAFASNKIEGNPLTEAQSDEVIENDNHRHLLKPSNYRL